MSAAAMSDRPPPSLSRPAIDARAYRSVLGRFVTGVTVMTVGGAGLGRAGVTANSFNTVSLDPPLILWSLALKAPSLALFRAHEHFGVSILAADQRQTALAFARPSPDKFAGVAVERGETGVPLVAGAMAHLECRVAHRYPGGDHEIIVGEVLRLTGAAGEPLVFHAGRFCNVLEDEPAA